MYSPLDFLIQISTNKKNWFLSIKLRSVVLNLDGPFTFAVRIRATTCGNAVTCVSRGAIPGRPCRPMPLTA